jgi:hypothetical protein
VSFDHIARAYSRMERLAFGDALEHARLACIADAGDARRADD